MPPSVGLATSLGQLIKPGQAALGLTALGLSALAADKQAPHERPQLDGSVITAVTRPICICVQEPSRRRMDSAKLKVHPFPFPGTLC